MKEKQLCMCGCGEYANPGYRFIKQHHRRGISFNLTEEQIALRSEKLRGTNHYRYDKTKDREVHLCACGCGGTTKPGNKYLHNHHMRGEANPMYGKKGEDCPNFGKQHTAEAKEKCRVAKLGAKNPNYTGTVDKTISTCACGCGKLAAPGKKYMHGHWAKTEEAMLQRCVEQNYCSSWYDPEYKTWVRDKRDAGTCQMEHCKAAEDILVHHINEDKKDCRPQNLVTLCRSCHTTYHKTLSKFKSQQTQMYLRKRAIQNTEKAFKSCQEDQNK